MKHESKKLQFNRQTVLVLNPRGLGSVHGGAIIKFTVDDACTMSQNVCSITSANDLGTCTQTSISKNCHHD